MKLRQTIRPHPAYAALALSVALMLPGCSGTNGDDSPTPTDSTPTPTTAPSGDFVSAIGGGSKSDEEPAPSDGSDDESGGDSGGREVEEADILVQDGDKLYILNMYRGLMVVDVANPDTPHTIGRLPLTGYPVEMYVRNGRAYIVVSDYFYYWRATEDDSVSSFHGSMLAIVDVSKPAQPSLIGKIDLEGYVSQTRAVGDVIYAVSNRYSYYSCDGSTDTEDMTNVVSIDISDPANPHEVDTLSWPGTSAQVHATPHSFYVIEPEYSYTTPEGGEGSTPDAPPPSSGGSAEGSADTPKPAVTPVPTPSDATPGTDPTSKPDGTPSPDGTPKEEPQTSYYSTHVTYIDISDPQGVMAERGTADVPGITYDKFALDEYNGTFRLATQKWDGVSSGTVSVLDVSDPDHITTLASMDLILPVLESITATRFDGERGYVVTAERTDPLFIIDLQNPSSPRVAGHVEMSGQLNHLEILGDRLVAFGQDNPDEASWRFAVSLFDVADIDHPAMLDREIIGDGQYSWSAATWDDKSFSVLPDEGLIAVPFTAYSEDWTAIGGVQLLDYSPDALTVRGIASHEGYVTRVRPVGDRLMSLSDTSMVMIDATNRDKPAITAEVNLAQYVADYLPMGDIGVQLVSPYYYWYGNSVPMGSLRIVDSSNPDEMNSAKGSVELALYDGQLVKLSDSRVAVFRNSYDSSYNYLTYMDVFDVRSSGAPLLTASIKLPSPVYSWASNYSYYYGSSGGALVQGEHMLAYLQANYYYGGIEDGDATDASPPTPTPSPKTASVKKQAKSDPLSHLYVIDVNNPDQPVVTEMSSEKSLFNLKVYGDTLYASHADSFWDDATGLYYARYYLDSIDVSNPQAPHLTSSINVPGVFQHLLDDGKTYVMLDSTYDTAVTEYGTTTYTAYSLKGVEIKGGRAYLLGSIPLEGYSYSMLFDGNVAYMVTQDYYWMTPYYDSCSYGTSVELQAIALDFDASKPTITSQLIPTYYGYLRGLHRPSPSASGYLFVDSGSDGMLLYSVGEDPLHPVYSSSERTSGYALHVRPEGDKVYLPLGMYGVQTVSLQSGESSRSLAMKSAVLH